MNLYLSVQIACTFRLGSIDIGRAIIGRKLHCALWEHASVYSIFWATQTEEWPTLDTTTLVQPYSLILKNLPIDRANLRADQLTGGCLT